MMTAPDLRMSTMGTSARASTNLYNGTKIKVFNLLTQRGEGLPHHLFPMTSTTNLSLAPADGVKSRRWYGVSEVK